MGRWRSIQLESLPDGHPGLMALRAWVSMAILGAGIGIAAVTLPTLDATITDFFRTRRPGGDLRRELEALQQFGAASSVLLTIALIASLDPARLRRLLDYTLAIGCVSVVASALKWTIGRARPKLEDPLLFLGPFAAHPLEPGGPPVHAWDLTADGIAVLHSMPSTHTTSAGVLAVFLATVYPRLRWFGLGMVALVACARVVLGAHWTSDVIVGAALALAIGTPIIQRCWGVRLVDWAWHRFVDRNAEPALRRVLVRRAAGPVS